MSESRPTTSLPREPTDEMIDAIHSDHRPGFAVTWRKVWITMYDAWTKSNLSEAEATVTLEQALSRARFSITPADVGRYVRRKSTGEVDKIRQDPDNGWLHPGIAYEWRACCDDFEYVTVVPDHS